MSVNLIEYTIKKHTIGIIPPNALLQIIDMSNEYDIQALAIDVTLYLLHSIAY